MKNTQKNAMAIGATAFVAMAAVAGVLRLASNRSGEGDEPTMLGAVPGPTRDPRAVTWDSKANTLVVQGNFPQAVESFQKALAIQDDPVIRYELGKALAKAGRRQEAAQAFQQVTQGNDDRMGRKAKLRIAELNRGAN